MIDVNDEKSILSRIQEQARAGNYELTLHARHEMVTEATGRVRLEEMLQAIQSGAILENYPNFYKGPCCLLLGHTDEGRPLHIVCSTSLDMLVFITVYEPTPPDWAKPTKRGSKS